MLRSVQFWILFIQAAGPILFKAFRSEIGNARSYALAALLFVAAILIKHVFGYLGATLSFAQFYPAVLITAVYGGAAPGLILTIGSVVYVWWAYWEPFFEFSPLDASRWANATFFVFASI